jgi:hypothetical protein
MYTKKELRLREVLKLASFEDDKEKRLVQKMPQSYSLFAVACSAASARALCVAISLFSHTRRAFFHFWQNNG